MNNIIFIIKYLLGGYLMMIIIGVIFKMFEDDMTDSSHTPFRRIFWTVWASILVGMVLLFWDAVTKYVR